MEIDQVQLAVIGLGYVGLPLAVEFGRSRKVVGYDLNEQRIADLRSGVDITREVDSQALRSSGGLSFISETESLKKAKFRKPNI